MMEGILYASDIKSCEVLTELKTLSFYMENLRYCMQHHQQLVEVK